MIIYDLNLFRPFVRPSKAHAPLIVDAYAMEASAIPRQSFKAIASWRAQIGKFHCRIDHVELPECNFGKGSPPPWADTLTEKRLGHLIGEAADHEII